MIGTMQCARRSGLPFFASLAKRFALIAVSSSFFPVRRHLDRKAREGYAKDAKKYLLGQTALAIA